MQSVIWLYGRMTFVGEAQKPAFNSLCLQDLERGKAFNNGNAMIQFI
jgi:hypothetical protein